MFPLSQGYARIYSRSFGFGSFAEIPLLFYELESLLGNSLRSGMQARAAASLGARPLIVLTAGIPYRDDPFMTDVQRDVWIHGLQEEEAHLSTKGKQIIVPDSDHMIPFERPDAIVAGIREVWSSAP